MGVVPPWYSGHVPRRQQRALSFPLRSSRLHPPFPSSPVPFSRKTGASLMTALFKYWPVRADLMEAVGDWRPSSVNISRVPVLREELLVPGLPWLLDNRALSFDPDTLSASPSPQFPAGISSHAVSRCADERRQHSSASRRAK